MHHHYQIDFQQDGTLIESTTSAAKDILVCLMASDNGSAKVQLLKNILKAINIQEGDYKQLTIQNLPYSLNNLLSSNKWNSLKVICFGLDPSDIGLNVDFVRNVPLKIGDKTFVFTNSLGILIADLNAKKQLWQAIQKVFKT